MDTTPGDVGGDAAPDTKLPSGLPVQVNLQVVWPSLDDLYLAPSLRPRPGRELAECGCDCGSKSGGGSGK